MCLETKLKNENPKQIIISLLVGIAQKLVLLKLSPKPNNQMNVK